MTSFVRAALPKRLPMFEAGFIAGCAYARADVLVYVGLDQWDIVEVKSTAKAKDLHIKDLALQRHVYEGRPVSASGAVSSCTSIPNTFAEAKSIHRSSSPRPTSRATSTMWLATWVVS